MANSPPVLTVPGTVSWRVQLNVGLATIVSAYDTDFFDRVVRYSFYDYGTGTGWLTYDGVKVATGTILNVASENLSQVGYYTGVTAATDALLITAFDTYGVASQTTYMPIYVVENVAPTVSGQSVVHMFTADRISFEGLVSGQDTDGAIVAYRFTNLLPGAGQLVDGANFDGTELPSTGPFMVPSANLFLVYYDSNLTPGTDEITIEAIDDSGSATPFTMTINVDNRAPAITGPTTITKNANQSFGFTAAAAGNAVITGSDQDGAVTQYRFTDNQADGGYLTLNGAKITGSVLVPAADLSQVGYSTGPYPSTNSITIEAIDNFNLVSSPFTIAITVANTAPTVTGPTTLTKSVNQTFDLTSLLSASDPDGTVAWWAFADPTPATDAQDAHLTKNGVWINSTSIAASDLGLAPVGNIGYYTGTSPGANTIEIWATDNLGLSSNRLQLTITTVPNTAPTITGSANVTMGLDDWFSFGPLITAADVDGEVAQYRFTDSYLGGGQLTYDGAVVSGTHITVSAADIALVGYLSGPTPGSNVVAIEAIDNVGAVSPVVAIMNINAVYEANQAPVFMLPNSGFTVPTGWVEDWTETIIGRLGPFSFLGSAEDPDGSVAQYRISDASPGADRLRLNGIPITGTSVTIAAGDLYKVGYDAGLVAGTNTIVIEAIDNEGLSSSKTMTIIVTDADTAGNIGPSISGPSSVRTGINEWLDFGTSAAAGTVVIGGSDVDGTVTHYRFTDHSPVVGFLTLNGDAAPSVFTVAASDLGNVGYFAGPSTGSNSIAIEAIDNHGWAASMTVTILVEGQSVPNQAPAISGPSTIPLGTNQSWGAADSLFKQLLIVSDADGYVAKYRFSDSSPGAGYLTVNGVQIAGTSVTVAAADLGTVGYSTGPSAGTNSIAIEAIDNLGLASSKVLITTIEVTGTTVGTGNQAPTISGLASVSKGINESFAFTSMISASDADGSVAQYRFWDNMPGAGYLTLNGVQIAGTSVTVSAANLGTVGYSTGAVVGNNAIAIEAIDNRGLATPGFLTMTINVGGSSSVGNLPPTVSGPASLIRSTNEFFTFNSLISASDTDGTVAQYRFSDSIAGAGYLTLNGAAAPGVFTVTAANLGQVGYYTGAVAGTNSITIESVDNLGLASPGVLMMTISVSGNSTGGTGGTGSTGGVGNQAPGISGLTSVNRVVNESFAFTSLISSGDADGTVAQYRFSDSTPGAGYLTLNGAVAPSVFTVASSNLWQVGYSTGMLAGSNTIAIEAIDNLGLASPNPLMMAINVANTATTGGTGGTGGTGSTGGTGGTGGTGSTYNLAPTINGQESVSKAVNEYFNFTSLISAGDLDGSVAQYRFSDYMAGAGHLTLNGLQIAGTSVTVSAADLAKVGYFTGLAQGSNSISIEAIDNLGRASPTFLMMAIKVNTTEGAGAGAPFDDAGDGVGVYRGRLAGYNVDTTATGYSVTIKSGALPTDTLLNMERLLFDDLAPYGDGSTSVVNTDARTIDGGTGIDTLAIHGSRSQYTITPTPTGFTISSPGQASQWVTNVERLMFTDALVALDINGDAGMAYRLYQAAFNRAPDLGGLGYQMTALDNGLQLVQVAGNFIASPEFQSRYGTLTNEQFVRQLYANVLHREAEPAGYTYHLNNLNNGFTRADVLVGFSESPENKGALIGVMQDGISYTL